MEELIAKDIQSVPSNGTKNGLQIIGIGTSAGGLEALESFFDHCPENNDMTFVIVQHLAPDYKSLMPELLARHTQMPVKEAGNGVRLQADHVYLIPSGKNLTIKKNKIVLADRPSGHELNFPIDLLFHSLAKEQGAKAIGVILSGTGSDGTKGGKAIKEIGGAMFVQDPDTTRFDGMPRSAMTHGLADFILPTQQMATELVNFITHPKFPGSLTAKDIIKNKDEILQILKIVKNYTDYDFFQYKKATLTRRILKRVTINKLENLEDYIDFLYQNPDERFKLVQEFLIGVTKFFRDSLAFKAIERKVIPDIIRENENRNSTALKAWVVSCSTGEEAYSLAILIDEQLKKLNSKIDYKIFATDIDATAIDVANKGIYSENIITDIMPERLSKYFTRRDGMFHIHPNIRKKIIFSKHDVLQNPPFSKMDLVTCRNMLIYLENESQRKALANMHYALNLNGFLFLGPSESLGVHANFFEEIHRKWKIYKNIHATRTVNLEQSKVWHTHSPSVTGQDIRQQTSIQFESRLYRKVNQELLKEFDAVSICVDERFEIQQAVGNLKKYLSMPEEGFSNNLLKILPSDFHIPLSTAIANMLKNKVTTVSKNMRMVKGDQMHQIRLIVNPLPFSKEDGQNHFLITLINRKQLALTQEELKGKEGSLTVSNEEVTELKEALKDAHANLQTTIEQLETTNEEMQTSNEELIASNEELQSTNEELQSVNEELYAVNAELQEKNIELLEANSDIENLMKSTRIGTIFLDRELRIRKFTPSIVEHFQLEASDIGRQIKTFYSNNDNPSLIEDAGRVLETLQPHKIEVQNQQGTWFLEQIFPYRTQTDVIKGVVVNFIDIDLQKKANQELEASKQRFKTLYEISSVSDLDFMEQLKNILKVGTESLGMENGIINRIEKDGRTIITNYTPNCGLKPGQQCTMHCGYCIGDGEKKKSNAINQTRNVQESKEYFDGKDFELNMYINAPILVNKEEFGQLCFHSPKARKEPFTNEEKAFVELMANWVGKLFEKHFTAEQLKSSEARNQALVNGMPDMMLRLDSEGVFLDYHAKAEDGFSLPPDEFIGKKVSDVFPKETAEFHSKPIKKALDTGEMQVYEYEMPNQQGEQLHFENRVVKSGEHEVVAIIRDITDRKQIERDLKQMNEELERFAYIASHDMQEPLRTISSFIELFNEDYKDQFDDQAHKYLLFIKEAANRTQEFVKDLLAYSILGTNNFTFEKLDMKKVLKEVLEDLNSAIVESKAVVNVSSLPTITADKTQLIQLFQNLVGNALKYRSDHPPLVTIACEEMPSEWVFKVEDNGIGIAKEHWKKIFEVFRRLHDKEKYSGTGIGLANCKRIVKNHRGEIWVDSKPGKGSTFYFSIAKLLPAGQLAVGS